jgi:predicted RNA-binding Zn-ribbon protein involved in translation (DUF1610 family)
MTNAWVHSSEIETRPWSNTASELICPRCQTAYLHHAGVVVYDRGEDGSTVIETKVASGKVEMRPTPASTTNPSSRRDGLAIQFWCENCGEKPIELTIAQHKGTTEMGWRYVE